MSVRDIKVDWEYDPDTKTLTAHISGWKSEPYSGYYQFHDSIVLHESEDKP